MIGPAGFSRGHGNLSKEEDSRTKKIDRASEELGKLIRGCKEH